MSSNIDDNLAKYYCSVIIPVYNKELYVARAIDSVLNQTHDNIELILVCDPSTDNSLEIIKQYEDPRIRVFYRNTPGPGGYAARNLGAAMSRGDWIAFLDADDEWMPDHLEQVLLLHQKYPEIPVIVLSSHIVENNAKHRDPFSRVWNADGQVFSFEDYLKNSYKIYKSIHTNTITIKRDLLSGFEVFPDGRTERSGDLYAWVRIMARARYCVWSKYVGAIIYKDIEGVTRASLPKIELFQMMVSELAPGCTRSEYIWLTRYANKLIKTAWIEHRLAGRESAPLHSCFHWKNHFHYCFFWSLISLLPVSFINNIRLLKNRIT